MLAVLLYQQPFLTVSDVIWRRGVWGGRWLICNGARWWGCREGRWWWWCLKMSVFSLVTNPTYCMKSNWDFVWSALPALKISPCRERRPNSSGFRCSPAMQKVYVGQVCEGKAGVCVFIGRTGQCGSACQLPHMTRYKGKGTQKQRLMYLATLTRATMIKMFK